MQTNKEKKENSFREYWKEERTKQRQKEAQRNPSEFTRAFHATFCILNGIIAIMLFFTIIFIPVSIVLLMLDVYLWRRYVIKKPEPLERVKETPTR